MNSAVTGAITNGAGSTRYSVGVTQRPYGPEFARDYFLALEGDNNRDLGSALART